MILICPEVKLLSESDNLFSKHDAVVVESLNIRNMVKNHHLAKSISDAAWGNFILTLGSKAENAGCHLLKVQPHGTSQNCSSCGETVKKSLSIRTHRCNCGLILDRDHNAAINILKRAATALRGGVLEAICPDEARNHTVMREHSSSPRALAVGS